MQIATACLRFKISVATDFLIQNIYNVGNSSFVEPYEFLLDCTNLICAQSNLCSAQSSLGFLQLPKFLLAESCSNLCTSS